MPVRREWPNILLSHLAKVLPMLLKAERENRTLSVTELIEESGVHSSTFYSTIRRALEEGQLIVVEPKPAAKGGVREADG